MTESRSETVRQLLNRAVLSGMAPGLVAAWQANNDRAPQIVAVGRAIVAPDWEPMTQQTWFDLASLTKPLVVGILSLLAMRDHSLTPETTVADVLPKTSAFTPGGLSIRQLLTHSSGLPAWEPIYALADGNPERTLEAVRRLNVDGSGAHVVYSCPGFILLGMILERLGGSSLDRIFLDRVIKPLGLEDKIGFRPPPSLPIAGGAQVPAAEQVLLRERGFDSDLIPPSSPSRPDDGNSRFCDGVSGNAGLFGTAAGVLALARVYLGVGEFLSAEEISLATSNHTAGLEQARGFGWQLASSPGCSAGPALNPAAFGHTGFTGTSLWVDPTRGVAMTLLANRIHPGHRPTDLHPLRRRFHQLVVG